MPARRGPPPRRPRRAPPRPAAARGGRAEAAWREFAASFVRAGMVPPAEAGLAAVEAAEGAAVLLLAPQQALTFTGKCRLTCLYGAVRVLGFAIASHQPGQQLFSPPTHCALALEALPAEAQPAADLRQLRAAARAAMRAHRVRRQARLKVMARFSPQCAVVLLEHLDTPVTRFLLSHPPLSRLFEPQKKEEPNFTPEDAVLASVGIVKCSPDRGLLVSESMFLALEELIQACCGPPFTHQRMPRKMVYYGQPSCEQDSERYIDVVKYVFNSYKKEVPLVINTMGWVKGEGLLLLTDIIRLLSPSHVVQMDVYDWKAMAPLTPEYVHLAPGLYTKGKQQPKCKQMDASGAENWKPSEGEKDASAPEYKLLYIHPEFPRAGVAGEARVHSSVLRDMAIVGYLGQLQPPDVGSVLPLHSLVPYQVPFSAVALRVIHTDVAPTNIMYAVNASWVGLCRIPDEVRSQTDGPVLLTQTPVCDCLGFGIVRGVEMEKKLYHILTPVPPENLRLVNCLLLGSVAVPNCIFVSQQGIEGEIPYVTSEYNYSILGSGKLKKKKHFKRREHMFPCDFT
ncbi:polynucleotide 5'-hydroxyl-kinase NOL9 isoform X2 [Dromaius novaehollandiae]|uniref:polynucleotide 5'-hydroxyl-kinase NOL9 isoform X2 n=1 Tax=Dromaius novaehollandiae TaxID=8790 RepID=UPI00311E52D2